MTQLFNGTQNNDHLVGTDYDDVFQGSIGDDVLLGAAGYDVVDYSHLGQAITMLPAGLLQKGHSATDQLSGIEEIIGAIGHANTINASGVSGSVSMEVNLGHHQVTVKNIPYLGDRSFIVRNFVNVFGSEVADTIVGNTQNNHLQGGKGNDFIDGRNGKDVLIGGHDDDTILGGNGNDTLKGNQDNDVLNGDSGNDSIEGNQGNDLIDGGNGHDLLSGGKGNDTISGGTGNDKISGGTSNDALLGGNGKDHIQGNDGDDFIDGGAGDDYIDGGAGDDVFQGSIGNDIVLGAAGYDVVDYSHLGQAITMLPAGLLQKDHLATDQLSGIEEIIGAIGHANTIDASGVSGSVSMEVNLGYNQVTVKNIPYIGDRQYSVRNFVNVFGSEVADTIIGNAQSNYLHGNGGNDLIDGAEDNDTLLGDGGSDSLFGGAGDDVLYGTDALTAGADQQDYLSGGSGFDIFVLADANGGFYHNQTWHDYVVISDFNYYEDTVQLSDDADYWLSSWNGNSYLSEYTEGHWDDVAVLENTELNQDDLHNSQLFQYV